MIDTKYTTLVRVLDRLCEEAPAEWRSYHPEKADDAAVNRARSRAYLHLFLKVRFGLLTFGEREAFVTEGSQDGGVDAFFIDSETRTIYFIQSKFRTTATNFENKSIELEELLQMDIDRILDGEMRDLRGVEYNSKIKALITSIRSLDNISRYRYEVVLLANVKHVARQKIHQLTGGFPAQIYDYDRCYSELLFPLVAATYYTFDDLHLSLNLSNKNAGSKISYSVNTEVAKLEITVVFVPTFEIAAAMNKYRNAILKYNPRSYLEHEGGAVNAAIKDSITKRTTNEFALFNNGITVLSDDTFLNERIGQKDRAQLTLINPQIINGGQTAYTLSRVFRELPEQDRQRIFGEKEVLLKIITFDSDPKLEEGQKLRLIDDISRATNSQTVVSKADRRSNEEDLKRLQDRCFRELGIWLERKRGEFGEGVREGYIPVEDVAERNQFLRATYVARAEFSQAQGRRVFFKSDFARCANALPAEFRRYYLAFAISRWMGKVYHHGPSMTNMAKVYVAVLLAEVRLPQAGFDGFNPSHSGEVVERRWEEFRNFLAEKRASEGQLWRLTKGGKRTLDVDKYFRSGLAPDDVSEFFLGTEHSLANMP